MWAFFKIQDGHQLHGGSKMDLLLQTLGRFWWSLTFKSFDLFPIPKFNENSFGNIQGLHHGDIPIMKHFGQAHQLEFSWKQPGLTLHWCLVSFDFQGIYSSVDLKAKFIVILWFNQWFWHSNKAKIVIMFLINGYTFDVRVVYMTVTTCVKSHMCVY